MKKQATTVGNCVGIIIDKPLAEKLKIKKGDYLEMDVKKI